MLVDAGRRDGRSRERILYWFRTPPGVKVGRPALDEVAIRFIEEHNPDIEFDWPKILEAQPAAAPPPDDPRLRRQRRDRERPRTTRPAAPPATPVTEPERRDVPSAEPDASESGLHALLESTSSEPDALEPESSELDPLQPELLTPEPPEPEPLEPELVQAFEQLTHPEAEEKIDPAALPVEHSLGREQLTRLRARYAELMARITERGGEPERIEGLRGQAESLNPDTWVTAEEVRLGVESFEPKIRDLRAALGLRRRRRSRRGGRRRRGEGERPESAASSETEPEKDNE